MSCKTRISNDTLFFIVFLSILYLAFRLCGCGIEQPLTESRGDTEGDTDPPSSDPDISQEYLDLEGTYSWSKDNDSFTISFDKYKEYNYSVNSVKKDSAHHSSRGSFSIIENEIHLHDKEYLDTASTDSFEYEPPTNNQLKLTDLNLGGLFTRWGIGKRVAEDKNGIILTKQE